MQVVRKAMAAFLALGVLALGVSAAPIIGTKSDEGSDGWLVDDAEVVMVVNLKAAMKSELMTKGAIAELMKKALESEEAKTAIKEMGMDPSKDLDSIIVSSSGFGDSAKARVVLQGKFDKDKLTAAVKKNDKVTTSKSGGIEVFEVEAGPRSMFGAFSAKGGQFIMTDSKEATVELAKNGPSKDVKKNKTLAAALKRFTGKESMAMAVVVTEEMQKAAEGAGNPAVSKAVKSLKTVTMSLTASSGLELALVGYTEDGEARALAKQLDGLKGLGSLLIGMQEGVPAPLKDIFEDIKIDNTRDTVTVSLKVAKETIEKLSKLAGDD